MVKWGWRRDWQGSWGAPPCNLRFLRALSLRGGDAFTHPRVPTEEGLFMEFKGGKVQNVGAKGSSPVALLADWSWAAGPTGPAFQIPGERQGGGSACCFQTQKRFGWENGARVLEGRIDSLFVLHSLTGSGVVIRVIE